jgi:UDP-N-acetylmuramoyl-tripeptide--D-alanyl-D-alanine ligase
VLTIGNVIEALTGMQIDGASQVVSEASIDSRQVIPAGLFFALPGERADGHDFVSTAFKNGAQAAFIQKDLAIEAPAVDLRSAQALAASLPLPEAPFCLRVDNTLTALQSIARFWRRKCDVRVVGITGSVGKSTTKELVAEVLSQRYPTLKNQGNLNNEIGLPLTLLRLGPGHRRAVLEMGFYVPGEISFLCDLALPSVGVLTNIGTVHAERAGSQEVIARGKAELVEALPPAPEGVAILNYDDPWIRPMASQTRAQVFYYGLDPSADLYADEVQGMGLEGISLALHYAGEAIHLRVPLIGQHPVHTVLRAAAVGLVEGLTWEEIAAGLQHSHTQLRLVAAHTEAGALLLDDTYNASPESTLAALNLLAELDGRRIAVLGDMLELGQYEQAGHEMVGVRAAEVCSELLAVGERGKLIADAALSAGMHTWAVHWVATVPEATAYLRENLRAGDVVLLKGSHGLRMDRIVNALEVLQ